MNLKIQNFKCYDNFEIEFPEKSLIQIIGVSGKGKSTILQTIYWCLYGSLPLHSIRPKGVKNVEICVIIKLNNITIKRINNSLLEVITDDDIILTGLSAQSHINNLFGTSNIFLASSYMIQAEKHLLLNLSNNLKFELLYNLTFDKSDHEIYLEKVVKNIEDTNVLIINTNAEFNILEAMLLKNTKLSLNIKNWPNNKNIDNLPIYISKLEKFQQKLINLNNDYNNAVLLEEKYKLINDMLKKIKRDVKLIPNVNIDKIEQEIKENEISYQNYIKNVEENKLFESLTKQIENLGIIPENYDSLIKLYNREINEYESFILKLKQLNIKGNSDAILINNFKIKLKDLEVKYSLFLTEKERLKEYNINIIKYNEECLLLQQNYDNECLLLQNEYDKKIKDLFKNEYNLFLQEKEELYNYNLQITKANKQWEDECNEKQKNYKDYLLKKIEVEAVRNTILNNYNNKYEQECSVIKDEYNTQKELIKDIIHRNKQKENEYELYVLNIKNINKQLIKESNNKYEKDCLEIKNSYLQELQLTNLKNKQLKSNYDNIIRRNETSLKSYNIKMKEYELLQKELNDNNAKLLSYKEDYNEGLEWCTNNQIKYNSNNIKKEIEKLEAINQELICPCCKVGLTYKDKFLYLGHSIDEKNSAINNIQILNTIYEILIEYEKIENKINKINNLSFKLPILEQEEVSLELEDLPNEPIYPIKIEPKLQIIKEIEILEDVPILHKLVLPIREVSNLPDLPINEVSYILPDKPSLGIEPKVRSDPNLSFKHNIKLILPKKKEILCPIKPEISEENIENLKEELNKFNNVVIPKIINIEEHKELIEKYNTYHSLLEKLKDLTYKNLINNKDKLDELKISLMKAQEKITKKNLLEVKITELTNSLPILPEISSINIEENVKNVKENIEKYESFIKAGKEIQKIEEEKENLQKVHNKLLELANYKNKLENIKKIILETSVDSLDETLLCINNYTNEILKDIFNEPILISFSSHKELKSKKDISKLQINMIIQYNNVVYDDYKHLSEGEKNRISFAITIAISKLNSSPLILIDETMSSIEVDLQDQCLKALKIHCQNKIILNICHSISTGRHDEIIDLNDSE